MFRTEIHPAAPGFRLELNDSVITAGSCFSEVIGNRLQSNKFPVLVNPFGTLFHPGVLCNLLQMALQNQPPGPETFVQLEGQWVCYLLHSSINAPSEEALQHKIKTLFEEVGAELRQAKALIITAGTAFLYENEQTGLGVANCHKQPQKLFRKGLSTVEELQSSFSSFLELMKAENPFIRIILTVSPVRHLKDTLELNAVSKAVLRLLTHQLCEQYPAVTYFPSYELLLDDLRDYRFYARDLLHPSEEAEDYIWQKFVTTYLSEHAQQFLLEWQKIRNALRHRPFNPTSEAHQQFIRKTIQKLEQFPYQVDTSDEIVQLKNQLQ